MTKLKEALVNTFEKLTKEELIELACVLVEEGLHSAGRKKILKKEDKET